MRHVLSFSVLSSLALTFACEGRLEAPVVEEDRSLSEMSLERPEQEVGARGIYMPIAMPQETPGYKSAMEVGGPPLPVFMNRFGGTYVGGFDDSSRNRSSVVGQGSATLGGYDGNDAQWQAIMDCVTEQFSRFNVTITDVEPADGDYVESVVGGHPSQVGLPNGVGGVAPIDNFQCNVISRAIVYTFTDNLPNNPQTICEVAAQEIAHAFSLDHEMLCEDPMTYLNGCGDKSFRDIDAQCGEFQVRDCNCNRQTHNSVQLLFQKLGAAGDGEPIVPPDDNGPPVLNVTYPADGETLPQNSQIQVVATATDDNRVTSMQLEWDFNGETFGCPTQRQGLSCAVNGDTYTWTINVGEGSRTFRVVARDVVGNAVTSEDRTVNLGNVSGDEEAPVVSIVSPNNGQELQNNSVITVVARATDNVSVASVELQWEFSGNSLGCPINQGAVDCTVNGDTYTWNINVGEGSRGFTFKALDGAGNEASTDRYVIELVDNPQDPGEPSDPTDPTDPTDPVDPADPGPQDPADPFEPNDSFETSEKLACAAAIDAVISPADDDWYSLNIDENVAVTFTATSADGETPLYLAVADAPDRILVESNNDAAEKDLTVTSATDSLSLRVSSAGQTPYRLVVTCDDALGGERPDEIGPQPNCATSTGEAPMLLALGLFGLAWVRRRRV